MKKMIVLLALLTFASTAWADPGYTTGNMLKLRKKPNGDSVAIEAYPKGEKLDVIGRSEDGKWTKVKIASDGKVGYMFAAYVSRGEPQSTAAAEQESPRAMRFVMKAPPETSTEASAPAAKEERGEKVVTLVSKVGEGEAVAQAKIEETLQQLNVARKEIGSLKEEVARLKKELVDSEAHSTEMKKRLATLEQVADFRLMSMVEVKGEEVQFTGLGMVQMAESNGRVIFKVPAELADKARHLFSKVNKNMLEGAQALYVTLDKNQLSLESRKG